ncbi:MAG: carbonate dehydratase [Ignavibacteriales bacterium]|nr:carbonate dehydratase [Ignavibacteriales bacterium]
MNKLQNLLDNNRRWASEIKERQPKFFEILSKQQSPEYLWIGCSDSRVPANEIVNLLPGELFVHRNVANVVVHTDLNCLSVIQYAVDVLHVKHIIVCGHYGCGGVRAALEKNRFGLIDNWLRHIQDVQQQYSSIVESAGTIEKQVDRLCELNVIEQVRNVCETTIIQDAWARGASLNVHGWIYGLSDGLIRDLNITMNGGEEINSIYSLAIQNVRERT